MIPFILFLLLYLILLLFHHLLLLFFNLYLITLIISIYVFFTFLSSIINPSIPILLALSMLYSSKSKYDHILGVLLTNLWSISLLSYDWFEIFFVMLFHFKFHLCHFPNKSLYRTVFNILIILYLFIFRFLFFLISFYAIV